MKKIARCQNQDSEKGKKDGENGEKSKSKSPSVKNGDDSESDLSFTGNDNGLTGTINYKFVPLWSDSMLHYMGRVKRIWYGPRSLARTSAARSYPSDRKPDPWPFWMAGHAQLKFVMTECSKTEIRLTRHILCSEVTRWLW